MNLTLSASFRIANKPTVCGEYWAYVFPLAAFANAWFSYAVVMGTKSAQFFGLFFLAFASLAFILVTVRDVYHVHKCASGLANWGDPLLLVESSCHPSTNMLTPHLHAKKSTGRTIHADSRSCELT